jgi:hypothetical protein
MTRLLPLLWKHGVHAQDLRVCVRDFEDLVAYEELEEHGICLSTPSGKCESVRSSSVSSSLGLPQQRKFCQDHFGPWCLFLDDDNDRFSFGNELFRDNLPLLALHCFVAARRRHVHLWGLNVSSDPRCGRGSVSSKLGLVNGSFFGLLAHPEAPILTLSDSVRGAAEDIERSVRYHLFRGGLLRFNFASAHASYWENPGGLQTTFPTKSLRELAHDFVVQSLHAEFPELIIPSPENRNRCRFIRSVSSTGVAGFDDLDAEDCISEDEVCSNPYRDGSLPIVSEDVEDVEGRRLGDDQKLALRLDRTGEAQRDDRDSEFLTSAEERAASEASVRTVLRNLFGSVNEGSSPPDVAASDDLVSGTSRNRAQTLTSTDGRVSSPVICCSSCNRIFRYKKDLRVHEKLRRCNSKFGRYQAIHHRDPQ